MKLRVCSFVLVLLSTATIAQAAPEGMSSVPRPASELPPVRSTRDPRPPAPSPLVGSRARIVRQAGIGGPVAYARVGVLELGGDLSFARASSNTQLSVRPSVGWFLFDNFELSLIAQVAYTHYRSPEQDVDVNATFFTGLVEPSVHVPLTNQLFVAGGLGVGVGYRQAHGVGVALAPRLGLDILIGRSGILKPSASLTWSSNKIEQTNGGPALAVATTWGINVGYTVMF